MVTNEIPVAILQAYFTLLRHMRKGMIIIDELLRQVFVRSWLPAISQRIKKTSQENYVWTSPFTISDVVLQLRDVPKTVIGVNQNGGHKQSLGLPVATALMKMRMKKRILFYG